MAKRLCENNNESIFENLPLFAYRISPDGCIVDCNMLAVKSLGYKSKKDLVGKPLITTIYAPSSRDKARRLFLKWKKTGKIRNEELQVVTKRGRLIDVLLNVSAVYDKKGKPLSSISTQLDITETKKAQETIQSLARFPSENPNPILRLNREGIVLDANRASKALLRKWRCRIGQKAPKYWRNLIREVLADQTPRSVEFKLDDQTILFHIVPVKATDYVNLYGRDITQMKLMEEKYRNLFSTMAQGVVYQGADGKIISANPAAERILGLTLDQMLGRTSIDPRWKAIHEDGSDFPGDTHPSMVALKTGREVRNVVMGVFNPREERHRWIVINAVPQFKPNEARPYQVYTTFDDITERKNMEDALRASQTKYRIVTDNIPVAVYSALPDSCCTNTFTSGRIREVTGYSLEDYEKDPALWSKILHPDDKERVLEQFQEHVKNKTALEIEYRIIDKNGSVKWIRDKASPALNEKGEVTGIHGFMEDVTERKRLEDQLKANEARYHALFEKAPISLWEEDYSEVKLFIDQLRETGIRDFRQYFDSHPEDVANCLGMVKVLDVNKTTLIMHQAPSKEYLQNNFSSVFRKETYDEFKEELVAIAEGKTTFHMEIVTQTVNGDVINADFRWNTAPGHEKTYSKLLISIVDITERKRMEEELKRYSERLKEMVEKQTEELRRSEERFRAIYENAVDGIHLVSIEDKKFIDGNRAFCDMIGYNREELGNIGIRDIHPEEDVPNILQQLERVVKGEVTLVKDMPVKRRDGTLLYVDVNASPTRLGGKEYVVGVFRDVTERKRLEAQLLEAQRMKAIGETAAMVGHDLRNPLQAMVNRLYLAKKAVEGLSQPYMDVAKKLGLTEMFKELGEQVKYMDGIVWNLQDVSRPLKPKLAETNVERLVRESLSMLHVPPDIEVSTEILEASNIIADPNLMKRVFTNLALNAFQAMSSGGRLTIKTFRRDNEVHISFQDTGVGISQEHMDKIWSPLYTTKAKGTGLGLSACKRIVEAHNGRITVESKIGEGSTFTVILPMKNGGD